MRTEQPRSATPYENVLMSAVSQAPVRRFSLPSPYLAAPGGPYESSRRTQRTIRVEAAAIGRNRRVSGRRGRVRGDVHVVLRPELLAHGLDGREAARLARVLRREVDVHARAVPVALDGLGLDGDDDAEVLADAVEDVARDGELVRRVDADDGADLVLPLARHDLRVGARDGEARVEARAVVRLGHRAAEALVRARAAVVRALGLREAADGPAERRRAVEVEKRVLLLEAVPRLLLLGVAGVELDDRGRARVRRERVALGVLRVAEHQDVVAAAERVLVHRARHDDDLRVVAGRLARRRAVVRPFRERRDGALGLGLRERAALGPGRAVRVDEDILGLDVVAGVERHVPIEDRCIHRTKARLLRERRRRAERRALMLTTRRRDERVR
mmetsp:Transcript_16051/g.48226  ORF Transcript_16051/g.48226 Transcript_16051/m.48226 type:complete len:387 (+) Transcript_16051:206-1366(+)